MKIENANFFNESKPIFIDFSSERIAKEQFEEIIEAVKNLKENDQSEIKTAYESLKEANEEEKEGITEKIKLILIKHGLPVAHSLTSAGIIQLGICLFGS